jgi:16S rRNA (guanine527-N7)-methyltransferase
VKAYPMSVEEIKLYFPSLTENQMHQLSMLEPFYKEWNEKINLISRKDMDEFMVHHVLHSPTLSKFMKFRLGTEILDVGTVVAFPVYH